MIDEKILIKELKEYWKLAYVYRDGEGTPDDHRGAGMMEAYEDAIELAKKLAKENRR